jgi:regulatory protein
LRQFAENPETAEDDIQAILDDLKKRGWLSDARFTEQLIHARKSKFGTLRVANELREKGIDEFLIEEALEEFKPNEFENALKICKKKFTEPPNSREDWAKQARFLQSRGFSFETIKKVLNQRTKDTKDLE